jgi:hypothetical protein
MVLKQRTIARDASLREKEITRYITITVTL